MSPDMTAVAWDEEGNEFIPTTDQEWFDYLNQQAGHDGESKWANAKTSDGSYWVWIPRFEYKISSPAANKDSAGEIDVRFIPTTINSSTSGYTKTTEVNSIVGGVQVMSKGISVSSDGYIIHPAFTSDPDIGGWDSELAGIWVAKYEMSMETSGAATTTSSTTIGNVATSDTIKAVSKPGVTSWRYINISNCYENSLAYDTSKNSHLMKNSEWGAVAYLTHSKYGRNGTEVTINSNSSYYTAGGSGATATTNVAQSSTGNATGIFDLAGGANEFVAAFNDAYSVKETFYGIFDYTGSASGSNMGAEGIKSRKSTAYLTAYRNATSHLYVGPDSGFAYHTHTELAENGYTVSITGDGIAETWVENAFAWFSDHSTVINSEWPFLARGGAYDNYSGLSGTFATEQVTGTYSYESSFRVCLFVPESEAESLTTDRSYVGCYADIDRDGYIDGVIFADQGYGQVGDGEWSDEWGTYEIPKKVGGLKKYEITEENYTIQSTDGMWDSNPHPVVSPIEGSTGRDRFYIMRLSDFTSDQYDEFYWYYNAGGNIGDWIEHTEDDFGEGYTNTGELITKWNKGEVSNGGYGAQDDQDIWKHIQTEYTNGWFIPSKSEWSAFMGELGEASLDPALSTSNYNTTYGLSDLYLLSSTYSERLVYSGDLIEWYIGTPNANDFAAVRLCTTF